MPQEPAKTQVVRLIPLFHFAMHGVLAVVTAKLLHLDLLRHGPFVLGRRVISTLALRALEGNDFSTCACHGDLRDV